MPKLLSGSVLRTGGSGDFIDLANSQPQLPATETTATGFTVATDGLLRTTYRSALGFVEFRTATIWSGLPEGTIRINATGTAFLSTTTSTGNLVVQGGIGVGGNMRIARDITVNGLTIGQGIEGKNNIIFRGTASAQATAFEDGQESIAIGYDTLTGLITSYKNIAIGRYALSSGSNISNTIAIGDSALRLMGTNNYPFLATVTNVTRVNSSTITAATNASPIVVTAASHGLTTGSQILISNAVGMTTATGSVSVLNNTKYWVNVLDPNSLALYTNKSLTIASNGTSTTVFGVLYTLTSYVGSGTIISPTLVTYTGTTINTGSGVYIDGINGTVQLNQRNFYVDYINSNTVSLFQNSILLTPIDGSGYTAYTSSGTIYRYITNDDNIAIGNDAAKILVNGNDNFFFGNNVAVNLTTGSNNTIIGHNVANNLTNVNGTIALGGDNLVDNRDNQVNIGSVFYYDGRGNTDLNTDVRAGLGTDSTGTNSGAMVILGGLGVAGKVFSQGSGVAGEDYELYTPTITITTGTAPANPRLGDVWINTGIFAYLQYIQDGTSTIWLQIVQL